MPQYRNTTETPLFSSVSLHDEEIREFSKVKSGTNEAQILHFMLAAFFLLYALSPSLYPGHVHSTDVERGAKEKTKA